MKNFSFVILNYNTAKETVSCVNSVINISDSDSNISFIIVDNGSQKEDVEYLERMILGMRSKGLTVDILKMDENRGFSAANNEGYYYAKQYYSPDFIIISNSDIEIKQPSFLKRVNDHYQQQHFSLLGPDIFVPRKKLHQSPVIGRKVLSIDFVTKEIEKCEKKIRLLTALKKIHMKEAMIDFRARSTVKNSLKNMKCQFMKNGYLRECSNEYIQGAFIICASPFIKKYDRCFEPEVFLYGEEDLLLFKCLSNDDKIFYSPELQVLHYSGGSTKKRSSELNIERQIQYWNMELNSKKILLQEVKKKGKREKKNE